LGVIEAPVQHHAVDLVGIPDVIERVGVEDDEVGEFSFLKRADILDVTKRLEKRMGGMASAALQPLLAKAAGYRRTP